MLANEKVLDKASYCKLDHYFFDITAIVLVLLYLSESLGISISLCFYKRNLKLFLTASQYSFIVRNMFLRKLSFSILFAKTKEFRHYESNIMENVSTMSDFLPNENVY